MRISWTTAIMTAAGVLTLVAGIAANGGPANAASSRPASTVAPYTTRYVTGGALQGVAATSATSAWAVGYTGTAAKPKTLIVAWNGKTWAKAPGFTPVTGELSGISAVSAKDAWAVGFVGSPTTSHRTLLLHWNGTTWARSPATGTPGGKRSSVSFPTHDTDQYHFNAVAPIPGGTVPGGTAWAVGTNLSTDAFSTLIMRWTGQAWSEVASPTPTGYGSLTAVAATSTGSAWAVGSTGLSDSKTLILHWNGRTWS